MRLVIRSNIIQPSGSQERAISSSHLDPLGPDFPVSLSSGVFDLTRFLSQLDVSEAIPLKGGMGAPRRTAKVAMGGGVEGWKEAGGVSLLWYIVIIFAMIMIRLLFY